MLANNANVNPNIYPFTRSIKSITGHPIKVKPNKTIIKTIGAILKILLSNTCK